MDLSNIITAIITGGITLLGVIITNSKTMAVIQNDLKHLTEKVEKHNSVMERTFRLEEQMKTIYNKVEDDEKALNELRAG